MEKGPKAGEDNHRQQRITRLKVWFEHVKSTIYVRVISHSSLIGPEIPDSLKECGCGILRKIEFFPFRHFL
ncbi:hypothetical protein IAS59_001085 [Cryptococcus gattii]